MMKVNDQVNSYSFPQRVIIEISRNCNLNCIMCGFGGQKIQKELFMTESLFSRIFYEVAFQAQEIRLNGRGESALHPSFQDFIVHCKNESIANLSLFTNFSWKNPSLLKCLKEYEILLFLSIDSPVKDEFESIRRGGSFLKFVSNLKQVQDSLPKPFLVFTLQQANFHRIIEIAEFALSYELPLIYNVVRIDDPKYSYFFKLQLKKNWKVIQNAFQHVFQMFEYNSIQLKIPDQIWGNQLTYGTHQTSGTSELCPNIQSEVFIGYNGMVYPCNMFNPYIYGNLREKPFSKIWLQDKHRLFLANHKENPYCLNCEFICENKS